MSKSRLLGLCFLFTAVFLGTFQPAFSEPWKRAYLASYRRSGNHWVRYLIEEATNIATSSVYCDYDPQHLPEPFPWGGYCCDHGYEGNCRYPTKDEIVVVKTHHPIKNKTPPFDRRPYEVTIRLVRHPVDAFYSGYVRWTNGKPEKVVPSDFVKAHIEKWRIFQTYWNNKKKVITFIYEDMLKDPAPALREILTAIHYQFTEEDIARAVAKYPPEGQMLKHKSHFSQEDLKLVSNELSDLLVQFNYDLDFWK